MKLAINDNDNITDWFEMLDFALDNSNDIVFIIDKNTDLVFANKKASDLLGYSNDEFLSMTITDIAPNIAEEFVAQYSLVGFDRENKLIIEMYYQKKDLRTFPVEVNISQFISSKSYYCSFVAKDMTRWKQVCDHLMRYEEEFVALVEKSPEIIVRYDQEFRCFYVNEAFEKTTGYSQSEMIGRFLEETTFLSEVQIQLIKHNFCLVIESGLPKVFDIVLPHAISRRPVHLQVVGMPEFNSEGLMSGVVTAFHDISEFRHEELKLKGAIDKAEKNSRMMSFPFFSISEEVNTTLNAIGLSNRLNDEKQVSDVYNKYLNCDEGSGKKLVRMVEDILKNVKNESDHVEINTLRAHNEK